MTIDEAIKYFEDCCKDGYCIEGENCVQCNAEMFALKALKEKRDEDKNREIGYIKKMSNFNSTILNKIIEKR